MVLKKQILVLKSEIASISNYCDEARARYNRAPRHTTKESQARSDMDVYESQRSSKRSVLSSREQELSITEKSPPPVMQPLPASQSLAFRVIFFLHMPQLLRRLAHFSCSSQQMLIPQPWCKEGHWDLFSNYLHLRPSEFHQSSNLQSGGLLL